MTSPTLHVVVIGGGIGGLCLAQGLKAAGVSVAVYERNSSDAWPEGYRIHINPVGSKALHDCLPPALWDMFVAIAGKPPAGLGFQTEQLKELVVIGESFMSNRAGSPIDAHYPVNRIALRHLLLAGMQDVIHFDKTFERYERTINGEVTAHFADGSSATGHVLVAADGANSRVRKQYLPQAQRVELDVAGIAGKLPLTEQTRAWLPHQLLSRMNLTMPPNRYSLFNAAFEHAHMPAATRKRIGEEASALGLEPDLLIDTNQDYILWAFIAPMDAYPSSVRSLDGCALQHFVGQMIEAWHPDLRRLVAESDPNSVLFNSFKTMVPVAPWESTNVTLLGDAIHNMPPVGGLGGNMALRDASLLAHKLIAVRRGELPLLPAIQGYEAEMRAYGFAAVRAALDNTRQATSSNRMARRAAKAWFRLCNLLPPLRQAFEASWAKHMHNLPGQAVPRYSRGQGSGNRDREQRGL
jgi:2-polyprenyl-6-methoxyphenol hydroxylase-like FAD-dependent oxidoreductase